MFGTPLLITLERELAQLPEHSLLSRELMFPVVLQMTP